ncbi:beta-galactosidase [Nocardiopsis tropica]|uniref:glycoside hydrolase family 35 protein n=1 Tax=Tsukamurella strandjordii TaxID=147577 RepID=UPI0031DBD4C1
MTGSARATLGWSDGELRKNGSPHRILAGAVHYFRVHPAQWRDRLERLAAMGANTVDTYVPWNFHEGVEGRTDFSGDRDIVRYLEIAASLGLDVYLRPGPYICAEWSNGGLPAWLTGRTRALRTSDAHYLRAVDTWFDELIPKLAPLQGAHGGPIVAVQVENEYGSYGSDTAYLEHLRDGLRARGIVEMLTTADGTTAHMQEHGAVPGALPTFTLGTEVDRARQLCREDRPLMCSELWGGWFDHWGDVHHVRSADSLMETMDDLLDGGGSVSLYMAHGGTNFGLWSGANHEGRLQSTVTSYDSDAPIGEDGRLTEKFHRVRASYGRYRNEPLPPVPEAPAFLPDSVAELRPAARLIDYLRGLPAAGPVRPVPARFEDLAVENAPVVYEAGFAYPPDSEVTIDGLHDRAVLFLDDQPLGIVQRGSECALPLPAAGGRGRLTILVESLGRINYGPLVGEAKGILGGVRAGNRIVHGWVHRIVPEERPEFVGTESDVPVLPRDGGGVSVATVHVDTPADAWLSFPGSGRAMVWLNDVLLGRYWDIGPTLSLYAPAPCWRAGANAITVLATDRVGSEVRVGDRLRVDRIESFAM